jgi:succinate dehydrogenase / fumarate reductase membrane anchor subunit
MALTRMRSPLGRAVGLGSAKEGVQHWWLQRVTAVALVPLVLWFVISVIVLVGSDRAALVAWLHQPLPAVLMLLLVVATFHHAALGLQVVIEDYIHGEGMKLGLTMAMRLFCIALAVLGVFSVLKLALSV